MHSSFFKINDLCILFIITIMFTPAIIAYYNFNCGVGSSDSHHYDVVAIGVTSESNYVGHVNDREQL